MKEIDQIKKLCDLYKFEFVSFNYTQSGAEVEVITNPRSHMLTFKKRVKLNSKRVAFDKYEELSKNLFLKLYSFYKNVLPILEGIEVSE